MMSFPLREVATGMPSRSASWTRAGPAPDARTPPPATNTGRWAPFEEVEGPVQVLVVGDRPEWWYLRELLLAIDVHLRLLGIDLALVAGELEMDRTGGTGGGHPKCLSDQVGDPLDLIEGGIELGDGFERRARHRLPDRPCGTWCVGRVRL